MLVRSALGLPFRSMQGNHEVLKLQLISTRMFPQSPPWGIADGVCKRLYMFSYRNKESRTLELEELVRASFENREHAFTRITKKERL